MIKLQSCRVNYNYTDEVCDNMIDKSINNINCVQYREKMGTDGEVHLYRDHSQVFNNTHFVNGTVITIDEKKIFFDVTKLEEGVCQAEIDSQKLDTKLNVYTAPFGK